MNSRSEDAAKLEEMRLSLEVEQRRLNYQANPGDDTRTAYALALWQLSEMLMKKSSMRLAARPERLQE
ncbi:MAG TPA: hypothetical protein VMB03_11555 [Bryobacteraceae bacterium]|nr:hypothetical protein [Bryobacteraceae bacterium]